MKYIKKFESKEEPKIGDYVLMYSDSYNDNIVDFVKNNIGKISNFDFIDNNKRGVYVSYDNYPEYLKNVFIGDRLFGIEQIVAFSESKEELELKISANKYNL